MRIILAIVVALAALPSFASDQVKRAQQNLEQVRALVDTGALPRTRLAEAQDALEAARDSDVLDQTLFGSLTVEELTTDHTTQMLAAARRQRERQQKKLTAMLKLVNDGVLARSAASGVEDELAQADSTVRLAEQRANLFAELTEMARAEKETAIPVETAQQETPAKAAERYDGNGVFKQDDFKAIVIAYEKKFAKSLPVSARGETEVHRAMGFDHRGRIDVALNPDQQEGVWLREYLRNAKIPYFAFRRWIPGKATAAHIHIGPPSLPYKSAD